MTKSAIRYVFILVGTLVLSLILWNFFIGVSIPDVIESGSQFEHIVWTSAEPTLRAGWLRGTGDNGLLSEYIVDKTWSSAKSASGNTLISVPMQEGTHPTWYASHA